MGAASRLDDPVGGRRGPRPLTRAVAVAGLLAASGLGGCGGGDEGGAGPGTARLEPPARPSPDECDRLAELLPARTRPTETPPPAGTYPYRTRGTVVSEGEEKGTRLLDGSTQVVVTPARSSGNIRCFRIQRRFLDGVGETATLAIRGGEVYATEFRFANRSSAFLVRPEQPVRSGDADALDWQGQFAATTSGTLEGVDYEGPARGRYAAHVIGRRDMKVGRQTVRVVGIEARASFAGEDVAGTDRSTRWLSLESNVLVAEEVEQVRSGGGETVRLKYRSRLQRLRPR